jgi:hypothetical protein
MPFLSTRPRANDVHKHKIKGKRGCSANEKMPIKVVKHANNGK